MTYEVIVAVYNYLTVYKWAFEREGNNILYPLKHLKNKI